MGLKLVDKLPGIGPAYSGRLSNLGYPYAYQVFHRFLKDPYHFKEWLRDTCGAYSNHQLDCYNCLNEYCKWYNSYFLTLVSSSGHFCKNLQYSVCAINLRCSYG